MKQLSTLVAWGAAAVVAAFAALNWATLMANAPLNLLVAQIDAPLGVVLLGMTAGLVALFLLAHLRIQIAHLLETRELRKELARARDLADKAEGSRVENLQRLIETQFRLLNERIDDVKRIDDASPVRTGRTVEPESEPGSAFRPRSLRQIATGT